MPGEITLIPTPLADDLPLDPTAQRCLAGLASAEKKPLLLVENAKTARARFAQWGLGRDLFEQMTEFHEQNEAGLLDEVLSAVKSGQSAFLLSDGGLPGFCDPGTRLVSRAHENRLRVRCLPVANAVAAAMALSGFVSVGGGYIFQGFPPAANEERAAFLRRLSNSTIFLPQFLMDTPYRLGAVLEDVTQFFDERWRVLVAADLFTPREWVIRDRASVVASEWKARVAKDPTEKKKEFVLGLCRF